MRYWNLAQILYLLIKTFTRRMYEWTSVIGSRKLGVFASLLNSNYLKLVVHTWLQGFVCNCETWGRIKVYLSLFTYLRWLQWAHLLPSWHFNPGKISALRGSVYLCERITLLEKMKMCPLLQDCFCLHFYHHHQSLMCLDSSLLALAESLEGWILSNLAFCVIF